MNTDEVRKRFEKTVLHFLGYFHYNDEQCRYDVKAMLEPKIYAHGRECRDDLNGRWIGYQQATKESEAEIEKLGGHITYLRDEIADREAGNERLRNKIPIFQPMENLNEDHGEVLIVRLTNDGKVSYEPPQEVSTNSLMTFGFKPSDWDCFITLDWNPAFKIAEALKEADR